MAFAQQSVVFTDLTILTKIIKGGKKMNNNQINFKSKNIDNIRVHIIKDIAVFIDEIYEHIPNMYIDIFGDSLSDELEAFCNLIITDNENTFKEKADVFKKRIYSRILRKTITDINKNSLAFFGLVKKIGFDLNESKDLEELYAGITAIIYTDVLLGLFEALPVCFENRKIKELPKKIEYLLN